ncbi:MAG TPA: choice-of-anchor E domain-containing protein [Puia sp.]|nr:choice-of-anchor E domain-containing protein [Puia sp.]
MKNVYAVIIASCACLMTFVPQRSSAQCLCSGGVAANTISYNDTLNPTNASSSTISFPKFDPSVGTLGCVKFEDVISGITTTNVWNLASTKTEYEFLLTVANNITGPGVSIAEVYTKIYGPDSLNAKGNSPGDSIVYGPDNLFSNVADYKFTSNTAPYLGASGTVNYTYTLNGGLISLVGSLNYGDQIITNYWGYFKLTYYWCPAGLLANAMSNFTAAKNGNYVQLKWQAQNEQKDISYEIEYSTDGGTNYVPINSQKSNANAEGTLASYQFQYSIGANDNGKLLFRIKRTSADGKSVVYSPIKTVNLNNGGIAGYHTYPNPVKTYTMIEFDQVLSGNYTVELVSTSGKVIQRKEVSLSGSSQIKLDLTNHPATGLYYLQVKDNTNNHQYISKLIIE